MKYVINIGRQLGSGGRIIGEKLAQHFQIAYYDKELIQIAAKESGLGKDFFERADEKNRFGLFGNFLGLFSNTLNEGYLNNSCLHNDSLFQIQSDVIRKLAKEQSCIFVGRCADYILREHPYCINLFISAQLEDRINQVSQHEQICFEKARKIIEHADKQRAAYYNYYSNKIWGMAASYHLCVNSSILGIDETTNLICAFIEQKMASWEE